MQQKIIQTENMGMSMFKYSLNISKSDDGSRKREGNVDDNLGNKYSVTEEYVQAFRTKSYTEIWTKVQGELRRSTDRQDSYHLSRYLVEPKQEFITEMKIHPLLVNYFELSLEACNICGFLLQCIDQTRANYCVIQRVKKLAKRVTADDADDQCGIIFRELTSFVVLNNPLSSSDSSTTTSTMDFDELIHRRYEYMLKELRSTRDRNVLKTDILRFCKRAYGVSLIIACAALAIVTLVLSIHGLVGIVAAPAIISCFPIGYLKKKRRMKGKSEDKSIRRKLIRQLDAAAKGIYTVKRDFDTMSRLVMRLNNEIEHHKAIARLCVRNKKSFMLKVVVKEFQTHEAGFLKQLGELEEHVYLCFLTINRARRLVIHEIMTPPIPTT